MINLPERKIGRGVSCESTSPVNYEEFASRPYLSYRNQQTSVGIVVVMEQVSYTMPTCGVSWIHSAITINPSGNALGINSYCLVYSWYTTGRHGITLYLYHETVGQNGIKITLETEIDALVLRARVVYTIGFHSDLNPVLPPFHGITYI